MTLYGVVISAVARKVKAFVAEIRQLVAEATVLENKIIKDAEAEARKILVAAHDETYLLRDELVAKIAAL